MRTLLLQSCYDQSLEPIAVIILCSSSCHLVHAWSCKGKSSIHQWPQGRISTANVMRGGRPLLARKTGPSTAVHTDLPPDSPHRRRAAHRFDSVSLIAPSQRQRVCIQSQFLSFSPSTFSRYLLARPRWDIMTYLRAIPALFACASRKSPTESSR